MSILLERADVFNTSSENGTQVKPLNIGLPSYSVKSTTTSQGIRAHTVKTKSTALAIAFYGAALDFDDEPLEEKAGKWHVLYFYADDSECDAVIMAATEECA